MTTRIGFIFLSVLLMWVMIGNTASVVMARRSPAAAVTLWPWNASALAERASEYAGDPTYGADRNEQARTVAASSLRESLLNPVAARVMGLTAAAGNRREAASRWFALSDLVSRRDLPTRLWLVQDRLRQSDLTGAIRHIDVALRTSNTAGRVLVPLLVNIASYPEVARPLAGRLAVRPVWWDQFLTALVAEQPASPSLGPLTAALRLDPANPQERAFASQALSRLVLSRDYAAADALYRSLVPGGPFGTLNNGGFEQEFGLAPFDWVVRDIGRIQRNRRSGGTDNHALFLLPGEAGNYVQQIQMLSPGRYRLRFQTGMDAGRGTSVPPIVAVNCFGTREQQIAVAPLPDTSAEQGSAGALDFTVPATDCPGQWVLVGQQEAGNPSGAAFWIDDITLERVAG